LSKQKIIKKLKQKNPRLPKIIIEEILDTFISSLSAALVNKKSVELRDFGTFFIKQIAEKKNARNPKTGELIYVPKRNKLRFKASSQLNKLINN
jgi:integration host factor subunit beta